MKRMFLKAAAWITGILSFTSCGGPVALYGMPSADFHLTGTVRDVNQSAIKGIKVAFETENTATYSDGNGSWDLKGVTFSQGAEGQVTVVFSDIDGPANGGEFENKTVDIQAERTAPGDGSWDQGSFEKTGINVTLEKQ